jgi:hypothetical protein
MNKHQFDRQAWAKLSMFEQMGNIGSEVGRTLKAKRAGDERRMQAAFYRGLDLIDASAQIWSAKPNPRLRELLRSREEFVRVILTDQDDTLLERYFMNFAVAARLRRTKS